MHVWRTRLERWFTPLARGCVLSPNTITVIALSMNLAAAVLLAFGGRQPLFFPAGTVLLIVAGLADAFDGIVARLQNRQTRFGDFLDHFADRVSDVSLAIGWMAGSGVRPSIIVASAVVIMLNGYAGTQIEATWKERSYEGVGRGEFVLALVLFPTVSYILATNGWRDAGAAGFTIAEWMSALMIIFAVLGIVQRFALAARLEKAE